MASDDTNSHINCYCCLMLDALFSAEEIDYLLKDLQNNSVKENGHRKIIDEKLFEECMTKVKRSMKTRFVAELQ